jgi:hypothetical protein
VGKYSVFNTSIGIQLFQSDEPVDGYYDGICMYLKVAYELGPNIRTHIWSYERVTPESYHPRAAGGIQGFVRRYYERATQETYHPRAAVDIQGFVRRYQTAYSELEHLGVEYTQRQRYDTLLKNFLCEPAAGLVELLRNQYQDSWTPFDDTCDHLLDYHDIAKWSNDQQRVVNPAMGPRQAQTIQQTSQSWRQLRHWGRRSGTSGGFRTTTE